MPGSNPVPTPAMPAPCRRCRRMIDKRAATCHYCGEKDPGLARPTMADGKEQPNYKVFAKAVATLGTLFLVATCYLTGSMDKSSGTPVSPVSFDIPNVSDTYQYDPVEKPDTSDAEVEITAVIFVKDVQKILAKFGYDPGPADGVIGAKTRLAIKSFQHEHDMQESGLLTDHVSENIYRYNPGCFIWANSDQDRLSGHGICQIAPKYNFKTIEVSVHGTGIYTLTISDRDGLALAANPAKLQASMKMMTDWLFLNRSYLYGVEVGILSGPSCIASATRTTKNLTRMRICS